MNVTSVLLSCKITSYGNYAFINTSNTRYTCMNTLSIQYSCMNASNSSNKCINIYVSFLIPNIGQ